MADGFKFRDLPKSWDEKRLFWTRSQCDEIELVDRVRPGRREPVPDRPGPRATTPTRATAPTEPGPFLAQDLGSRFAYGWGRCGPSPSGPHPLNLGFAPALAGVVRLPAEPVKENIL
uniref:Uncharacterized protein n=1 Tax=Physcomitrium patens TaxID=3218 RepID=A0A2K1KIX2_PHYPA|nr:hypothetical protein PHYPA_007409 [Physcomitrium patens]